MDDKSLDEKELPPPDPDAEGLIPIIPIILDQGEKDGD